MSQSEHAEDPEEPIEADDVDLADDGTIEGVPREGFCVRTEEEAEWVLGVLAEKRDAIARLDAKYKRMRPVAVNDQKRAVEFFTPHLESYYEANRPRKGKTLSLLNGDLKRRRVAGGVRIEDEGRAIAALEVTHPELVLTEMPIVKTLDRPKVERLVEAMIDSHIQGLADKAADGEIPQIAPTLPDGISYAMSEDRFYVEPSKPAKKGGR